MYLFTISNFVQIFRMHSSGTAGIGCQKIPNTPLHVEWKQEPVEMLSQLLQLYHIDALSNS